MSAAAVVRGPAQARWVAALRDVIAAAGPSRGGVAGIWADPGSALVVAVLAAAQAGLTPRVLTDQEYAVTGLEVLLADGSWPGWFDEAAAPASPVIEIDGTAVIDALLDMNRESREAVGNQPHTRPDGRDLQGEIVVYVLHLTHRIGETSPADDDRKTRPGGGACHYVA